MKRFIKIVLLLLAVGTLGACGTKEGGSENTENTDDKFVMYAEITAVGEKIEVDVYEAEYADGPYWINTDKNTVFTDESGKKISLSDLKAGEKIKITYNGQVAMSYPPQVYAIKIAKIK